MFNKFNYFNELFSKIDSIMGQPLINDKDFFSSLNGDSEFNEGIDEIGKWSSNTYKSKDNSLIITSFVRTSGDFGSDDIDTLKKELKYMVESENFESAIKLRDRIKKLEDNKDKLENLNEKLKKSIESQNFEESIKIRDEIKKLK